MFVVQMFVIKMFVRVKVSMEKSSYADVRKQNVRTQMFVRDKVRLRKIRK